MQLLMKLSQPSKVPAHPHREVTTSTLPHENLYDCNPLTLRMMTSIRRMSQAMVMGTIQMKRRRASIEMRMTRRTVGGRKKQRQGR